MPSGIRADGAAAAQDTAEAATSSQQAADVGAAASQASLIEGSAGDETLGDDAPSLSGTTALGSEVEGGLRISEDDAAGSHSQIVANVAAADHDNDREA